MHVPWNWVKQRPHFLAEELSAHMLVDVLVPKAYRTSNLSFNKTNVNIKTLLKLPYERFRIIRMVNSLYVQFLLKYLYKIHTYEFVWLTDLRLFPYIESLIHNKQNIIYDCMDDVLEFELTIEDGNNLRSIEERVLSRSNLILFSSVELYRRKLLSNILLKDKPFEIIPNAMDINFAHQYFEEHDITQLYQHYKKEGYIVLTYIGTISNWFDLEIVEKSLHDFPRIVYFLIGPIEQNMSLFKHERLIYLGTIQHRFMYTCMQSSDILIMPFKLTNLIKAVDPVKLYEYIASGKSIISIFYPELEKFREFVHFYYNYSSYHNILTCCNDMLIQESFMSRESFIQKHSWHNRMQVILNKLKQLT